MKNIVFLFCIFLLSFSLGGCVVCQECGSLRPRHEVTNLFLNNEIVPGHRYYYNGRSQWPSAIMAIDSSYTIKAEFWKPVELAGQELSEWLQSAANWKGSNMTNKQGAEILNPEGERVGIWFSKYDNVITKFLGDKVIQVYPPSYRAGQGMGSSRNDKN